MDATKGLLLALVLGNAGCDPDVEPPANDPDTTGATEETGATAPDLTASIIAAHGVGSQVVSNGDASAQLAAQAVEFATASVGSGELVTTGTVEQRGSQYAYDPSPDDALVVVLEDAPRTTFRIHAMDGDFSSASAFLAGDHELRFAVEVEAQMTLEIGSVRRNGAFDTSAAGTILVEGLDLDVDVHARGTSTSEVDSTGSRFHSAFTTTGTVTGPAFDLVLDETWDFELVTAGDESAQSAVRTLANTLSTDGDDYDWVDVRTQKSYRDGRPSELDTFWTAQGQLLRNGQPFGAYRLDADPIGEDSGGFVLFMLDLPEGSFELERIAAY